MGNIIIPSSNITPSFKQGYARRGGESTTPDLWRELVHIVAYQLGHNGVKDTKELLKGHMHGINSGTIEYGRGIGGSGTSLIFNGTNTQTNFANPAELNSFKYISFAAWIRPKAIGLGVISAKDNQTAPRCWQFRMEGDGKLGVIIWNQSASLIAVTTSKIMEVGKEYHVCGTWDGTTIRAYINGIEYGNGALAGTNLNPGAISTFLGTWSAGSQQFDGDMGSHLVWNRALHPSEVLELAKDPYAPFRLKRRPLRISVAPVVSTGDGAITLPNLWMNNPNIIHLPILAVTSSGTPANVTGEVTLPMLQVQGGGGATGAITLPLLVTASTATQQSITNDGDLTLPLLTVAGGANNPLSGSITLPSLTVLGEQKNSASGNIILPMFNTETVVQQGSVHQVSIQLPMLTLESRVGLKTNIQLPSLTISGNGSSGFLGTFDRVLPSLIINVKASQKSIVTGNITLPSIAIDGNLLTGIISLASGNRTLPTLQINAHAFRGENGNVAITLPALELQGEGFANPTGDGAISLPIIELDVFADVHTNRII